MPRKDAFQDNIGESYPKVISCFMLPLYSLSRTSRRAGGLSLCLRNRRRGNHRQARKSGRSPRQRGLGSRWQPIERDPAEDLGAKQFSIGGSLAHSTFRVIHRAAEEIRDRDNFSYYESQVLDAELCRFFVSQKEVSMP